MSHGLEALQKPIDIDSTQIPHEPITSSNPETVMHAMNFEAEAQAPATPAGECDFKSDDSSTEKSSESPKAGRTPESSKEDTLVSGEGAKVAASDNSGAEANQNDTVTLVAWIGPRARAEKKWSFPWELCKTWKGAESLIREAFDDNPVSRAVIETGQFTLEGPDRKIILPHAWETLVEPGLVITIKFTASFAAEPEFPYDVIEDPRGEIEGGSPNPEDEQIAEDGEKGFKVKIKYTVKVFERSRYEKEPIFQYSKSYNHPHGIKTSTAQSKTPHVLEETTELVRPETNYFDPLLPPRRKVEKHEDDPRPELLSPGDYIRKSVLIINSPLLLNALRSVVKYSSSPPSGDADCLANGAFDFPFLDLYHHKNDLLRYKNEGSDSKSRHTEKDNKECDRHIDILLEWLYGQKHMDLASEESRWSKKTPTTTFNTFRLLMKSGVDVYVQHDGRLDAYVVERLSGGPQTSVVSSYTVTVWKLSFNGTHLTRLSEEIIVPVWDGERDITSLPLFPTRFYKDEEGSQSLEKRLIERGRKYFRFSKGPIFQEYTGRGSRTGFKQYERARVVVVHQKEQRHVDIDLDLDPDFDLDYRSIHDRSVREVIGARGRAPKCQCENCEKYYAENSRYTPVTYASYDKINPRAVDQLSDHQYFLCSGIVTGFILKDRQYDTLDIENVSEPKISLHAIDRLVMKPETNKSTIKAICEAYTKNDPDHKPFFADTIRGKGEGQIILLHGPPGTGKTLTAESVAEYTRRPLLSITTADLGHEPPALEKSLLTFFRNANEWDAIVLLDEADVYLERRSVHDLRRNSIVSVFLRALEYFQGILFLTTNRVGSFDEAFMSRIHIQIGYDPLNEDARAEIWNNNFQKLKDDYDEGGRRIEYEWDTKEYVKRSPDVKSLKWNGREIRNAFQTAVALAVYEAQGKVPVVKEKHLKQVVDMSKAFKLYIKSTHGGREDSQIAYDDRLRDDEHNVTME